MQASKGATELSGAVRDGTTDSSLEAFRSTTNCHECIPCRRHTRPLLPGIHSDGGWRPAGGRGAVAGVTQHVGEGQWEG